MQTKLTLRLDEQLVKQAHAIAEKSKDSISNMFAVYIKRISSLKSPYTGLQKSGLQKYRGVLKKHPKLDKKDLINMKFGMHEGASRS